MLHISYIDFKSSVFQGSEDDYYPDELNDLVGKKIVFRTDVDDLNIKRNSRVYTVFKMTDDEQVLAKLLNKDGTVDDDQSDEISTSTAPTTPTGNGKRRIGMVGIDHDMQPSATKSKLMPPKTRKK